MVLIVIEKNKKKVGVGGNFIFNVCCIVFDFIFNMKSVKMEL